MFAGFPGPQDRITFGREIPVSLHASTKSVRIEERQVSEEFLELKCKVARSQLATALDLFLRDKDPISVQCLACGGAEVIEAVAEHVGEQSFSTAVIERHPTGIDRQRIVKLRNQFWNAFKHLTARDGETLRLEDVELLSSFADHQNDAVLFWGWYDYMMVRRRLPIEVQIFQVWWYTVYEDKLSPWTDIEEIRRFFPDLLDKSRTEQKRRLRRAVEKYRSDKNLLGDPRTEPRLVQ